MGLMNHIEAIDKGIKDNISYSKIIRKVYLCYPHYALIDKEDVQFEIFDSISKFFLIPYTAVQLAGSAKTGYSFHKKTAFKPKESDLDIAIIDPILFQRYVELVFEKTKGYTDRTHFRDSSEADTYIQYITKGIFRIDLMPSCPERARIDGFFNDITRKNQYLFKSINAGIYMSQVFFEAKQRSAIKNYKLDKGL